MKKNNKKGFTLVELVIVVAVMAVLVAVAIPTIGSIKGSAETAVNESNARTIESVIKLAEANATVKADGSLDLDASDYAEAIYNAKLGITKGTGASATTPTFYCNLDNGAVTHGTTAPSSTDYFKIEFDTAGKVTVTPKSGSAATHPSGS